MQKVPSGVDLHFIKLAYKLQADLGFLHSAVDLAGRHGGVPDRRDEPKGPDTRQERTCRCRIGSEPRPTDSCRPTSLGVCGKSAPGLHTVTGSRCYSSSVIRMVVRTGTAIPGFWVCVHNRNESELRAHGW